MKMRIQKWENSLGVRILRSLAEQIDLGAGTEVSLSAKYGEGCATGRPWDGVVGMTTM
jgi:antitoxin component of MazEF toxin-antitoxin module